MTCFLERRPVDVALGFGRGNGIPGDLCQPELHGRLGLHFDRITGRGIAAHPCCTLCFDELAQKGDRELAALSDMRGCGLSIRRSKKFTVCFGGTSICSAVYRMSI